MNDYLEFHEIPRSNGRKTKRIAVISRTNAPNPDCLTELATRCRDLTRNHKASREAAASIA